MAKFVPSPSWKELNFTYKAKNFSYNRALTEAALGASKFGLESLTATINHLAAYQPKVIYSQSWPNDYHYIGDADPLVQFTHYDYNTNGREYRVQIIASGRDNFYDYCYAWKYNDPDYITGNLGNKNWKGPEWKLLTFDYVRGDAVNDVVNDGISQMADNEFEIWDVVVQEKPISFLDTDLHTCIVPGNTRDHVPLGTTEVEAIRATMHDIRVSNLPVVLRWSALTTTECSATQAAESTGIAITSTSFLNVWDLTTATRTATSPGTLCYAFRAGRGNETNNQNVKVIVRAYARVVDVSGTPSGTIRFEGPSHVGSNYNELTVTNTSYDWIGGTSSDYIYLNADSDYDDITTTMNKIDVLGKITATDTLQILGLFAWVEYE